MPRAPGPVGINRSSGNPDEGLDGEGIDRFSPAAILDGQDTELPVIQFRGIGHERLLGATEIDRAKQDQDAGEPGLVLQGGVL
jgi:hypothetical protein